LPVAGCQGRGAGGKDTGVERFIGKVDKNKKDSCQCIIRQLRKGILRKEDIFTPLPLTPGNKILVFENGTPKKIF